MPEAGPAHLSIGEVLGLLLEEFPDVTISKIRFLESQGLIEPERTPSGYRKFFDGDVELLRMILREQRENFLPLRVIKDRIDSGQLDATPPRGASSVDEPSNATVAKHPAAHGATRGAAWAALGGGEELEEPAEANVASAEPPGALADECDDAGAAPGDAAGGETAPPASAPRLLPGVLVSRNELCSMSGVTPAEMIQLEEYGILAKRSSARDALYGDEDVEIAAAAAPLLRAGVDARHLRGWRTSVEREAGLFEQLVLPLMRHRNPQARAHVAGRLAELDSLSSRLRDALMRAALGRYAES